MKRVLLTGASGFVGRHCLRRLLARGWEVQAISRRPCPGYGGSWHAVDLLADHGGVAEVVARAHATHLLHLAWDTSPSLYWDSPENLRWAQAGLELIQEFGRQGGQRLVVSGTCTEYEWGQGCLHEEWTPLAPSSLYGTCKHALRLMVESFASGQGLSFAWGRLFFLYGPHERPERLVPSLIRGLLRGQPTPCSHGRQVRDFLFVEDAAEALVGLLESDLSGAYNIASGAPLPLRDLTLRIGDLLGGRHLLGLDQLPARADEPPRVVADVSRLSRDLHWTPRFSLDEGLERSIRWWRDEMGLTQEPS